jgi:hypothetical protein
MTPPRSADPEIRFSVDVTDVVESLKNSGFASTNADVTLIGASIGYKYGYLPYNSTTHTYVRLGVLARQTNFETYAVGLVLANKIKNGEALTRESVGLESNINYLSNLANSGLMHLKSRMKTFGREVSEILPEMIHEALGISKNGIENTELASIGEDIQFNTNNEGQ